METIKTTKIIEPKPCDCKAGKWQYIQTPQSFFEAFICNKHGYIIKKRSILFNTFNLSKLNGGLLGGIFVSQCFI